MPEDTNMESYMKSQEVRWSDLDPNFHMMHSKYYELGAYCRVCYLDEHGINAAVLQEHKIGPILLREECSFRREIKFGDKLEIDLRLHKAKENMSRWTIRHTIYKNGQPAAHLEVDGAWIDMEKRKIAIPPPEFTEPFLQMPRTEDFHWF
jgi:acyl-CoA thioester hydrolase